MLLQQCAVFTAMVDGRLDVNVALNRPSYQSSIMVDGIPPYSYVPGYANDGNTNTHLNGGPCMHTLQATNPWWAVDLVEPQRVVGIEFTNRDYDGMLNSSIHLFESGN